MCPLSFGDVERRIVEQHETIRKKLRDLTEKTARVRRRFGELRAAVRPFAAHFDAHLAFEERELAPRIRQLDAWGKVREATLLAEHHEQRRQLERLCALAEHPATTPTRLSDAVRELADGLLEDMINEEQWLDELGVINEHGHVDQMTG